MWRGVLGLGLLGALAWRYVRSGATSVPTPAAPPREGSSAPPAPDASAPKHRAAAAVMQAGARIALGHELGPDELIYCLGVAKYETSYGQGWKGAGVGSNNWGSVHAKGGEPSFPWRDSHPDGRVYAQAFKSYPTPEEGAADVVRHVLKHRASVARALGPGATLWRASLAMRRTMYYGSWCKAAVAKYGASVATGKAQREPSSEGDFACEREAIGLHVWRMAKEQGPIAAALGLPLIPEGTYEEAATWYKEPNA